MKQFKVFVNYKGSYEAVKQGWSWPAFFFGGIWALVKKMWNLGFGVFGVFFAIGFIGEIFGGDIKQIMDAVVSIGSLVLPVVFGVNGNKWRETNLIARGFDFRAIVTAANAEGAVAIYMKNKNASANENNTISTVESAPIDVSGSILAAAV